MIAAIQKKNDIDVENNWQNSLYSLNMATDSTKWLP